jgi:hypothetical protein
MKMHVVSRTESCAVMRTDGRGYNTGAGFNAYRVARWCCDIQLDAERPQGMVDRRIGRRFRPQRKRASPAGAFVPRPDPPVASYIEPFSDVSVREGVASVSNNLIRNPKMCSLMSFPAPFPSRFFRASKISS